MGTYIETISDFIDMVCGEPVTDVKFEVFDLGTSETVFEGTWEELQESSYVDRELASIDVAGRIGYCLCFNIEGNEDDDDET